MANATLLPHGVRLSRRTGLSWQDPRDVPRIWTPRQRFVWRRATYTVPNSVSEERVQATADKYKRKLGQWLEADGWTVLGFDGPTLDRGLVAVGLTPPDRRCYVLRAKVTRRPQTIRVDVPDEDVPFYQQAGFALAE